ncbi:hypothetical protein CDAR_370621 [Caerostris darwini]|uniref:Uncharacterized protein n=1 Tax=Caerostris darwini TaxID=1538125 RepID=A0AAV4VFV9_9ARAC|nr:hypothetical protein CDAR_370621 [Caerostris darwini]
MKKIVFYVIPNRGYLSSAGDEQCISWGRTVELYFRFAPFPWNPIRKRRTKKKIKNVPVSFIENGTHFLKRFLFPQNSLLDVLKSAKINRADERSLTPEVKILKNACGSSCCRFGFWVL